MTWLDEVKARIEAATPPDCADNSCRFAVNKTGMRTNGGCRCYHDSTTEARHYVLRLHEMPTDLDKAIRIIECYEKALKFECGNRCHPEHNPCNALDALAEAQKIKEE